MELAVNSIDAMLIWIILKFTPFVRAWSVRISVGFHSVMEVHSSCLAQL